MRLRALLMLAMGACVSKGTFPCTSSAECGAGICGPQGFCAFDDSSCSDGHRYGEYAPEGIAGVCVSDVSDGGGTADAPRGTADGPIASADANRSPDARTTPDARRPIDAPPFPDAPAIPDAAPPADAGPVAGCVDQLAAGSYTTCALRSDGVLLCAGDNDHQQLGVPGYHYENKLAPAVGMGVPAPIRQVSMGDDFDCVLDGTGAVYCLGDNYYHEVGRGGGDPSTWFHTPLAKPATQIVSGNSTTCAILDDQTVQCWGANDTGQLGDGTTNPHSSPQTIAGVAGASQLAVGAQHACALLTSGDVTCWGDDTYGELGDNDIAGSGSAPKTATAAMAHGGVQIVAGGTHTCIRDAIGNVFCWGSNDRGEIGDGTEITRPIPAKSEVTGATSIGARGDATCAILADKSLWCWGADSWGQLGDHQNTWNVDDPQDETGFGTVLSVAVGDNHICALKTDGSIACIGGNDGGQLANGTILNTDVAVKSLITDGTQIATGAAHGCARRTTGGMSCWGDEQYGELGMGFTNDNFETSPVAVHDPMIPPAVTPIANAQLVDCGLDDSCAINSAGGVDCWGRGYDGELADGMEDEHHIPHEVAAPLNAGTSQVSYGYEHACALKTDGTVYCWGANYSSQLGNGDAAMAEQDSAVQVTRVSSVLEIAAGGDHTCARTASTLSCWGDPSEGELGGTPVMATDIVPVSIDATQVTQMTLGYGFSCALTSTNIYCWGSNDEGELGDGTTSWSATPKQVLLGSPATFINVGATHACAIRASDGAVFCWGSNDYGELGDGTFNASSTPVQVQGLPAVATGLALGENFSCALLTDASVWCWGLDDDGQLGTGALLDALDPVAATWTCP
jgi:alpha-tubulin suppressor-like RCC1 family protein